tara:strand:+ start:12407 stop:13171 length:765 start_codon:yes stop_codon:yes gene_type:complete
MNKNEKYILELYQQKQWSTYQIAEKLNTYPNKIRRILQKHGIVLRKATDAQKNALDNGRAKHPTKGKQRSEDTKQKISESQGLVWDRLTEKEKLHRSKIGKQAWEQKTDIEKQNLILQAQEAVRESSRKGSKLEHFLLSELGKHKIKVEFHKEHWLQNHNLQIDLYLPTYKVAIEVDGPSHFKPVWGQENLARNIKADQQKTGLILQSNLVMVRIKQDKSLTQRYMRTILQKLLGLLDQIGQKYPQENERYFEL